MRGRNEKLEIHVQACRSNLTISNHQSQEPFYGKYLDALGKHFPPFWKKGAKMARNIKSVREADVKLEFWNLDSLNVNLDLRDASRCGFPYNVSNEICGLVVYKDKCMEI